MCRRFAFLTTSLTLIGAVLASPDKCAAASPSGQAESSQIAQVSGDLIACRSSPSRHCVLDLALLGSGKVATKAGQPNLAQNAFTASLATAALLHNDPRFHHLMLGLAEAWAAVTPISADRQIAAVVAKAISAANAGADGEES